jgi:hypothetical protein
VIWVPGSASPFGTVAETKFPEVPVADTVSGPVVGVVPVPSLDDTEEGGGVEVTGGGVTIGAVTVKDTGLEVRPSVESYTATVVVPALRLLGTVTVALVLDHWLALPGTCKVTPFWVNRTNPGWLPKFVPVA